MAYIRGGGMGDHLRAQGPRRSNCSICMTANTLRLHHPPVPCVCAPCGCALTSVLARVSARPASGSCAGQLLLQFLHLRLTSCQAQVQELQQQQQLLTSCQLSTAVCQLSTTVCQLSMTLCQLSTTSRKCMQTIRHISKAACKIPATACQLSTTSRHLSTAVCQVSKTLRQLRLEVLYACWAQGGAASAQRVRTHAPAGQQISSHAPATGATRKAQYCWTTA